MKTAVAYIRISIKDQSSYSLEGQERTIRDYCQRNELELIGLFKDDGESSYTFDRPDFKKLEAFLKKNPGVDYLVALDYDRFSRNLAEALMKIKELKTKFGIQVLATTDPFNTDFSDPSQFMMRAFKLMMAESELHRIRKRTKEGIYTAKLAGRAVNKAPYGYLNTKGADGKPTLAVDEEKALIVRRMFTAFIAGTPVEEIRKVVAPLGYKQAGSSAIQRILTNPLYAGLVKVPAYGDKPETLVDAIHPPIISKGQYWTAQGFLNEKKRVNFHANEEVPLKGVLRCPQCGAHLSASHSKGKKKYYWYYLCATHRKNFSAVKVESQFNEMLDLLSLSEKQINFLLKHLTKTINDHLKTRGQKVGEAQKALRSVMQKIETVEERYLEGGVSKETYSKVIAKNRSEAVELQRRIYELGLKGEEYFARLNNLMPMLYDLRGAYEILSLASKHRFISLLFGGNLTYTGAGFRTPYLDESFSHNALILKEKGLLEVMGTGNKKGSEEPKYREGESIRTPIQKLIIFSDLFAA